YRSEMNFTWESLAAAQETLNGLYEVASDFDEVHKYADIDWERDFLDAVGQDMNMPKALGILHDMLRANIAKPVKAATLFKMDEILGLKIRENAKFMLKIPDEVLALAAERDALRRQKKFVKADHMRIKIEKMGYIVEDQEKKTKVLRKL
ncbi:MAG TPA: hypothetical protein VG965_06540, partial [Patescibacteria group bacterium]|nr:hypothetical protein [Patescibacteria group bacterium]